jgi:Mat/Ecp fimbriae major subunit
MTSGDYKMNKVLRLTSLVATVASLAVTATEASAAPVNATSNATARARVLRPLQLASTQNLDLGIIVLSGAGAYTATVGIDRAGTFNCDSNSGNVTCSGTPVRASYNVSGTNNQVVTIASGAVTLNDGAGHNLTLTPDHNPTVTLTNSGAPGTDFWVGGSISVPSTTTDGVYTGTFALTADYQ